MADAMLAKIRKAEENAEQIKNNALKAARELESQARERAQNVGEETFKALEELAKSHEAEMENKRRLTLEKARMASIEEAHAYKTAVQKNMDQAVQTIVKKVEAYGSR